MRGAGTAFLPSASNQTALRWLLVDLSAHLLLRALLRGFPQCTVPGQLAMRMGPWPMRSRRVLPAAAADWHPPQAPPPRTHCQLAGCTPNPSHYTVLHICCLFNALQVVLGACVPAPRQSTRAHLTEACTAPWLVARAARNPWVQVRRHSYELTLVSIQLLLAPRCAFGWEGSGAEQRQATAPARPLAAASPSICAQPHLPCHLPFQQHIYTLWCMPAPC